MMIFKEVFVLAKLTRSGIAYNLEDSPHMTAIDYPTCQITYIFSSDLYKRMFLEKLEQNRQDINKSLTNRFGFPIVNNILCDIKMYLTVEKRGFLILVDGLDIHSPNDLILEGYNITKNEIEEIISPELEKIEDLKNAGIITDEEYEIMKNRIKGV